MQKIDFKNYPDATTPINADNLNLLQTNVENSISEIEYNVIQNDYGNTIVTNNGLKICHMRFPVKVACKTAFGSLYRSASISLPDFPIEFTSIPTISYVVDANGYFYTRGSNGVSTTNSGSIFALRTSSTEENNITVNIIAIGI